MQQETPRVTMDTVARSVGGADGVNGGGIT
jgi:hypothetical protein